MESTCSLVHADGSCLESKHHLDQCTKSAAWTPDRFHACRARRKDSRPVRALFTQISEPSCQLFIRLSWLPAAKAASPSPAYIAGDVDGGSFLCPGVEGKNLAD